MSTEQKLTERQQRFVEAYAACGNASEAARQAGYKGRPDTIGSRLLGYVGVARALRLAARKRTREAVATAAERREFWTKVLRGQLKDADMKDRLKASELLGKSQGDFAQVAIINPAGADPVSAAVATVDGETPIVTIYVPANGRDG